ncbi:MAG: PAS domain-containing protein, partial [Erysipelotrichaceae bacterium]|nr:PAS domain-containing protein [Erysipelotrichaceae bacterium]
MANKIFRSILMVAIFVLAATAVFVIDEMYQSFVTSQLEVLQAETRIIAHGIEKDGIAFVEGLDNTDYRLTLIDKDGTVLFDNSGNDISGMDNHLDRAEVIEALEKGYGFSSRQSATLTEKLVYTAVRLNDGRIIRLSETYHSIFHVITIVSQPLLLVILFIIIVSFVIALRLTGRIVEPLNQLDLDHPDEKSTYKELRPIIQRIAQQQEMIDHDREVLERKRQEFDTITSNMNEGLILLNREKEIIDINKAACQILGIDENMIGKSIELIKDHEQFSELFNDALMKHHGSKKINIGTHTYEFEVSPVETDGKVFGFVLLLFDESYKEANEKMRREFAGNVSHELKTPLQSISGYTELLKNGMVNEEDRSGVYERIYFETERMMQLISDIIRLSRLDDDDLTIAKEVVDLDELCKQIINNYQNSIGNNVEINYEGSKTEVYGNRELLEMIIYNLCDNAVKYNKETGKVFVSVYEENDEVYLKVKDTGQGIP